MLLLSQLACLLGPAPADTDAGRIAQVAQDFREHYALFEAKRIEAAEWDELEADALAEPDLWSALTTLTGPLDDNHVHLLLPDTEAPADWFSGSLEDLDHGDFDLQATLHALASVESLGGDLYRGAFDDGTVYLRVGAMTGDPAALLEDAVGAPGIVLDLRHNRGGDERVALALAAALMPEGEHEVLQSRRRSGPEWGAFTAFETRTVRGWGALDQVPLTVWKDAATVSAGEWCLLALSQREDVVFEGPDSAGALGTVWWRELSNGWLYSLSVTDVRDLSGETLEGRGL